MEWTNGGRYAKRCKLRFNAREAANQDSSWKQDRHPGMSVSNNPSDWMREKASTPREMPCVSPGKLHKREPPYRISRPRKTTSSLPCQDGTISPCPRSTVLAIKSLKPARHRCMGDMDSAVSETLTSTHGGPFKEDAWQTINPKASLFQPRKSQATWPSKLLPAVSIHGSDVRRVLAIFPATYRQARTGPSRPSFASIRTRATCAGQEPWSRCGKMGRRYGTAWGWRAPIEW